jgi:hypothetical protein
MVKSLSDSRLCSVYDDRVALVGFWCDGVWNTRGVRVPRVHTGDSR